LIFKKIFFFKDFIYLREREHKQGKWQAEGEGEAGLTMNREPDAALDPRTPGSWPEPKEDA